MTVPGGPAEPHRAGSDTTINFGRIEVVPDEGVQPGGLSPEEQAAVSALPRHSALLIMQRGPGQGSRFLLDDERTVAGRSERADIFLDDVTVSRKHAEFVREGNQFVVRDVGSLNGTYVNRNRIDSHLLATGDEVQIGKYRLTFHASRQSVEPTNGPATAP
ncbi:FHA domain-containing protein [Cellulosimicrobium arenosum]|uniref:FHA domain-containing protein n=1 Tax=Cellulosimicrobium arenosum TaxID=2708133 RepID=A0A927G783_9MICO|nr:FHA domain-containing protein [Cellulosimicrobium arenosum]MBD8077839.1 FHA domain-containing protein [Cellulosimicrobium arenosum]